MRIWWQSFVDETQNAPYLERLDSYLNEIAAADTEVTVVGVTPGDRHFGRLAEFRCAAVAIDNALEATEQGFDAIALGHFQDPGLYEMRSATELPVVGLGESTLHWAAQLGRHLALVSINSVFERWHLEQADLYGLSGRITHVTAMEAVVEDFTAAFDGDSAAYDRLLRSFRELAAPLVDGGADVIIPAGGLPALLFAREHGLTVQGAPVVNSVAVALKLTEAAFELRRLTGLEPSRGPSFALAPPGAIADFRGLIGPGRRS